MVAMNKDGLWLDIKVGDVAMPNAFSFRKNPTWKIYETLRKIGVKPNFRGPFETDPGKYDKLYYKEWEFKKNHLVQ